VEVNDVTFGERLRELREAIGMSEAKLAEASGITFGSIHGYGLDRRKPSFEAVVKIARALGSTCEAFADCDGLGVDVVVEPPRTKGPTKKATAANATPAAKMKVAKKRKEK
jgi:transcriptional regulator with XRE-family HTH domain